MNEHAMPRVVSMRMNMVMNMLEGSRSATPADIPTIRMVRPRSLAVYAMPMRVK